MVIKTKQTYLKKQENNNQKATVFTIAYKNYPEIKEGARHGGTCL